MNPMKTLGVNFYAWAGLVVENKLGEREPILYDYTLSASLATDKRMENTIRYWRFVVVVTSLVKKASFCTGLFNWRGQIEDRIQAVQKEQ